MTFLPVGHPLTRPQDQSGQFKKGLQTQMQSLQDANFRRQDATERQPLSTLNSTIDVWRIENLEQPNVWRQNKFLGGNSGGVVLDTNQNGRFDPRQDSVLTFDMDGNGRLDRRDVAETSKMMQAVVHGFDFDQNGKVSLIERMHGNHVLEKYRRLDRDGDEFLSASELIQGNARVWIDRDGDRNLGAQEISLTGSANGRRITHINPFAEIVKNEPSSY